MVANISFVFNEHIFINMSPPFNCERFYLWKVRMIIFVEAYYFEIWDFFIKSLLNRTYYINDKLVNKSDKFQTEDDKRKVKIGFKTKYLIMRALRTKEYLSVFNCNSTKKVWDTLEWSI